jgi:hypothetical protein
MNKYNELRPMIYDCVRCGIRLIIQWYPSCECKRSLQRDKIVGRRFGETYQQAGYMGKLKRTPKECLK